MTLEITRVSTKYFHQNTLNDMTKLQTELGSLNRQISSGKKVTTFKELSALGQTERVLGFENQLSKIKDYVRSNTIVTNRLQSYNNSVSGLIDIAEELRNILILRRTPTTGDVLPLQELVTSQLSSVKSNLNVELEGRFLFAGTKTDTPPIGDIETANYTTNLAGQRTLNTNYYQGDDTKVTIQANDALQLEYGITADNPAFQNLIAAMHMALEGDTTNNDDLLADAVDLVSSAISELSSVQANINNNITILDKVNDEHSDFKLFLDEAVNSVTETDIGEASIDLATTQTTLQATFSAFARISSLKLTDYLR